MFHKKKSHFKRRKGYFHSIEGILAVLLLIGYIGGVFYRPSTLTDWDSANLRQELSDYLGSLEKTNLIDLILENKPDDFKRITASFFDPEKDFSLSTENLLKPKLIVGVLTGDTTLFNMYKRNITDNIYGTDYRATVNNRRVEIVVLQTNFTEAPWGGYNVLVIPVSGTESQISATLGTQGYSSVINMTYFKTFSNNAGGIVLVSDIPNSNILDYTFIKTFLNLAWSQNITDPTGSFSYLNDINPKEISYEALKYFSYIPLEINTETSGERNTSIEFFETNVTDGPGFVDVHLAETDYRLGKAFCTVNLVEPCGGDTRATLDYTYTLWSTNSIYHYTTLNLKRENYGFVTTQSGSNTIYDRVFIDYDNNDDLTTYYFTNDTVQYSLDELTGPSNATLSFDFQPTTDGLAQILITVEAVGEEPSETAIYFNGVFFGNTSVISSDYNITQCDNSISLCNYTVLINVTDLLVTGLNHIEFFNYLGGIPLDEVLYHNISATLTTVRGFSDGTTFTVDNNNYTIIEIEPKGLYVKLSIDTPHEFITLNTNSFVYPANNFSNSAENDSYFVIMYDNALNVLGGNIPVSIVNYLLTGSRNAWVVNNLKSQDEWHILRSLIFFVSDHHDDFIFTPQALGDVVTTRNTMLSIGNIYQPYWIDFRGWYRV
ncbi:MAG: hypothetical protein K0B02_03995 [DPANN group archaeon]|nr:hypothetical protein [DPANN group archaeon]